MVEMCACSLRLTEDSTAFIYINLLNLSVDSEESDQWVKSCFICR